MVEEVKINGNIPFSFIFHTVKVLHCLRDTPGFVKLVGVTLDAAHKHIKSYIIEPPPKEYTTLLMRTFANQDSSWVLVEIWARQIIERIRQVHSRGLVVGSLGYSQSPSILVDISEQIFFQLFANRLESTADPGALAWPPECQWMTDAHAGTMNEKSLPKVTSKVDIYQLSVVLWSLAKSWTDRTTVQAARAQLRGLRGRYETNREEDYILLLALCDTVPRYYRDLVDVCRAKNPFKRPPCHTLLQRFPSPLEVDTNDHLEESTRDLHTVKARYSWQCSCDVCHGCSADFFFHCNICNPGNFEICEACFQAGRHCLDKEHMLIKMPRSMEGSCTMGTYYYSSPDVSGHRELLEL